MSGPAPWQQRHWDWRAAGNFIAGGTGSGLAIAAAVSAASGAPLTPAALIGAAGFIAVGLTLVWLEIGRPWRFIHVLFHPQTSWMTREAFLAPFLLMALLLAAWRVQPELAFIAAALAFGFLACQALILHAAKGIPAWREPLLAPLIMASGLTEGCAALTMLSSAQDTLSRNDILALLILVFLRWLAWGSYRARIEHHPAPHGTRVALRKIDLPELILATALPGALLAEAVAVPELARIGSTCAALLVLGGGWIIKFTVVTRAAFNQGFALPHLPVRGYGRSTASARPGWSWRRTS
jgi:phenylacetyl-CoA:acceptor oxidoreductase subunit 2